MLPGELSPWFPYPSMVPECMRMSTHVHTHTRCGLLFFAFRKISGFGHKLSPLVPAHCPALPHRLSASAFRNRSFSYRIQSPMIYERYSECAGKTHSTMDGFQKIFLYIKISLSVDFIFCELFLKFPPRESSEQTADLKNLNFVG